MKAKLAAIWAKIQPVLAKAPLPVGIAIGYLGHPAIKLAIDAVAKLIKAL